MQVKFTNVRHDFVNFIRMYLMTGEVTLRLAGKLGISTTSSGDEPLEPLNDESVPRRPPALLSFGICVSAIMFMRMMTTLMGLSCEQKDRVRVMGLSLEIGFDWSGRSAAT